MNKYLPHVHILPEDDANRQLAVGFLQEPDVLNTKARILPVAGGWLKVLEQFVGDSAEEMESNRNRYIVLLFDFDGQLKRLEIARSQIPKPLSDQVFVLWCLTEPEDLKKNGSYEAIGRALAKDCIEATGHMWNHDLLRHNAVELERPRTSVRPILFEGA